MEKLKFGFGQIIMARDQIVVQFVYLSKDADQYSTYVPWTGVGPQHCHRS